MGHILLMLKNQWATLLTLLERCRAYAPERITVHYWLSVLLFGAVTGLYHFLKGVLFDPSATHVALVMAVALAFVFIQYGKMAPGFRILLRSMTLMFTLYAVGSATIIYPSPSAEGLQALTTPGTLRWIAIIFGSLGLLRPTLGLPAFLYPVWQNTLLQREYGFPVAGADYLSIAELGILLVLGLVVFWVSYLGRLTKLISSPPSQPILKRLATLDIFVLGATALHFATYFWSAIAKCTLDGGLFSWVTENNTHYVMLISLAVNALPISFSESVVRWTHDLFSQKYVLVNAVMLLGQLLTVIIILRRRLLLVGVLLYAIMHLLTFAVTGTLFWAWIWLDATLVMAVRAIPTLPFPRIVQVMLVLLVVGGNLLFSIGEPAGYNTRATNLVQFYAITQSGETISVPTNYFLAASRPFAQMNFAHTPDGALPTGPWGTTPNIDIMRRANACTLRPNGVPTHAAFSAEQVERFVRLHHAYVLQRVDKQGRLAYDLYPHHIWSVPWKFREFDELDKRRIAKYSWVTQSACLDFQDGKVVKKVLTERTREIQVAR